MYNIEFVHMKLHLGQHTAQILQFQKEKHFLPKLRQTLRRPLCTHWNKF